jgi:RecJ-like exonuclease
MNKFKGKYQRDRGKRPFSKNKGGKFDSFRQKQSFNEFIAAEKALVVDVTLEKKNQKLELQGTIDRIVQTGGPTIFHLNDGTGSLALKGFEAPGARAHAHINEGDFVSAIITVQEYNHELEGEISSIKKLSGEEKEKLTKHIQDVLKKRAKIEPPEFLVKSKILDKLKSDFTKAATEIRYAIFQNRPIIVRHHNDADGYSSGFALEKAIVPLVSKQHGGGKSPWEFYTRSPVSAPMYEIDDSIRDTAMSLSDVAKFSNKMPLVIIADTGSGEEDLLGIQHGKIHGIDFIVIDHHVFDKDVISEQVLVHINPFLVGEDGSQYSAGMLCAELARFINPEIDVDYIPSLAGLADRINNPEVIDHYIKIAEKKGYTKQLLHDISALIDFVSQKLRFMEAREYMETVFGEPIAKQKQLVSLMAPHIRKLEEKGLAIAESNAKREKIGKNTLQMLNIEEVYSKFTYPKPGKSIGLLHDKLLEKEKNVISVGIMADLMTFRATESTGFSVHKLIDYLNENAPEAFVEGGGHHLAGAIKFVPNKQKEIISYLKLFIQDLK